MTGLGVRCAQALGLHLTNRTPNLTDSQRNLRLGIWFSMLSLERTIAVITGRPSMVQDLDCSMLLPDDGSVDPDKDLRSSTSSGMPDPWRPIKRTGSNHSFGQTWRHIPTITTTMDPTFFVQYAHLTSLAASVLTKLYSPQIRHVKWSELQSTILELDKQLSDWNDNLPASCRIDSARQGSERQADLIAIRMLFHSTRIIINRPCLCRLDRRIRSQSKDSNSININSASRCVASARCILALLPDQPDLSIIYQGSLWWMGFHHIKRAATVLILEITYLSEHTPAAGEDILVDAKKGINWLHAMGTSSSPAHSSWVTLSQLLLRAARKFGGDVSDAVIAEEEEPDGAFTDFAATQEAEDPQSFGSMFGMEGPNVQFEFEGDSGADNNMFGDLTFGAWDQFGFGPGSFFPAAGDLDETMEGGGGDGSSAA